MILVQFLQYFNTKKQEVCDLETASFVSTQFLACAGSMFGRLHGQQQLCTGRESGAGGGRLSSAIGAHRRIGFCCE
ncbi:hypothetical protein BBOR36S_03936 [Brevibacillus borstelensis]|nr:hypothetical protein BBO01nite_11980 [Brevibacillus borstelensis]